MHDSMEHDLEDPPLIGEEGKKRFRIEYDNFVENGDNSMVLSSNRKVEESDLILRRLPGGKPIGCNENFKLECLGFGETSNN